MRNSERVVIARIFEQLTDEDQEDDEQMSLLVHLLDDLDNKDLPIDQIVDFMLTTCKESDDLWLLVCDHLDTWDACQMLVARDPQRVPLDQILAAFHHACAISEGEDAEDTDDDPYLERLIELVGHLGTRFPMDALIPLLQDERILIRLKVIEALAMMEASSPIVSMLSDVSAQIRIAAMEHLGWMRKLTDEQLQTLAVDASARVRASALQWMQRHRPEMAAVVRVS